MLDGNALLEEAEDARQEMLCLMSWYNEISNRDPRFDEVVYRLMAAEKYYQVCLEKLRSEGIGKAALPYSMLRPRRGLNCAGFWYGW